MRQTLRIGITILVVAALAMSGIALAQTDEGPTDEEVNRGVAGIVETLAPLIEAGTITEAQAEAVAEHLAANRPIRPKGHRPGVRIGIATAAEVLGMEVEELAEQLKEGATLAEVAGSQTDAVIDALVAQAEERLAEAVADGKLTQEEADEKLAEIQERITTFVNEGPPERPAGEFGHRRGPRGGGPGGDAPAEGTDA